MRLFPCLPNHLFQINYLAKLPFIEATYHFLERFMFSRDFQVEAENLSLRSSLSLKV